jgi:hypothetical protein
VSVQLGPYEIKTVLLESVAPLPFLPAGEGPALF